MTSPSFACVAVIDASPAAAATATAWRDSVVYAALDASPQVQRLRAYAGFNTRQSAVIGQCADSLVASFDPHGPPPEGVSLRVELAELTYEKLQAGVENADEEAILYSVQFKVPDDWTAEFDRWYEEEHVPMIYECRDWSMTRRYRLGSAERGGPTHLALHYLSSARGLDAPQLRAARVTPWRNKFLGQRWFTDVEKMIYFRQTPVTKQA